MNNIKAFSKFIDQPLLMSKLNSAIPKAMTIGGGLLLDKTAHDEFKHSKDTQEATKNTVKKGVILASVIASSIVAPKIANKLAKRSGIENIEKIKEKNKILVDDFIKNNLPTNKTREILNKAKEKSLSIKEVATLMNSNSKNEQDFLNKLIPEPENIKAKDIFSEIGYLSAYGAIPVLGGIAGGIIADKATNENYKENIPDKINEGLYQYLANIFLCNIGAGSALGIMEKLNIKKLLTTIGKEHID